MPNLISRFSSRNQRLSHVFLKDRLKGAETYDRIAGYFRSSIFDLIHEEISTIGRVRIVCNADLDPRDLTAATLSQKARDQAQVERWHEQGDEIDALLERPRWRRLHELLTAGNVVIRVVSCDNAPFRHGNCDHARQDIMMRRGAQCLVQLSNRQMDIDSCVLAYIYIRSNSCNAVTE